MNFQGQHLLSARTLSKEAIERILEVAKEMEPYAQKEEASDLLKGKVLATLFFEPSTRTRFSFETAMLRLGGSVISNYTMNESSSIKKRESLYDTGKTVSQFADVIAMRHPVEGAVKELAEGSEVPVLNGGDGGANHPTQGLLDIYTIHKKFGHFGGLTYGLVGDMKNSRVAHSQCRLIKNFGPAEARPKFICVAPQGLELPEDLKKELTDSGCEIRETTDLEEVIGGFDVLSNTRIQEERFENAEAFEKYRGVYSITPKLLEGAKEEMIILDPLPRVDDQLKVAVDDDPRAKYFEQIGNGVAVRMALLALVLGKI
ncbi:aspartate carbamoyltransferase [Candidatus Peregrinibacteria bacterium]|jgi:aspartate carbamoyltransferase catalytic subunit|nr:aspartate carbamoyltransferase [Candidatus Peregrinibacteria bacterium]MBT7484494.1 aspartate carbamoyltransferase [Candidatus Peregrinibacteria bacterium]